MNTQVFLENQEEKIRQAFKSKGVNIPADRPLEEIEAFCGGNCQSICWGPNGIIHNHGLTIEICQKMPRPNSAKKVPYYDYEEEEFLGFA